MPMCSRPQETPSNCCSLHCASCDHSLSHVFVSHPKPRIVRRASLSAIAYNNTAETEASEHSPSREQVEPKTPGQAPPHKGATLGCINKSTHHCFTMTADSKHMHATAYMLTSVHVNIDANQKKRVCEERRGPCAPMMSPHRRSELDQNKHTPHCHASGCGLTSAVGVSGRRKGLPWGSAAAERVSRVQLRQASCLRCFLQPQRLRLVGLRAHFQGVSMVRDVVHPRQVFQ